MSKLPAKGGPEEGAPRRLPIEELYDVQPLDWLPGEAIDRQMHRLISAGFPKYAAINAFALMQRPDGKHSRSFSTEYQGFTSGYFNPEKKSTTIAKITAHFQRYGAERYRRIEVWDFQASE